MQPSSLWQGGAAAAFAAAAATLAAAQKIRLLNFKMGGLCSAGPYAVQCRAICSAGPYAVQVLREKGWAICSAGLKREGFPLLCVRSLA